MVSIHSNQLAIDGGRPVRQTPLPVAYNASGKRFDQTEYELVAEVLRSGTLTRWGGQMVDALEEEWRRRMGIAHAVAVGTGSGALHTALAALQLEPGSEVITSGITDMGTLIAILHNQLIPVFVDVDIQTGMILPASIERAISSRTSAVVFVHLFGRCADLRDIRRICDERGVVLVEDASQAHFASRAGVYAGSTGTISAFSLQQSKVVSCGEGGMVVTGSADLAGRAQLYQNKGWVRGHSGNRAYPSLGHNFRMTELQAAIARGQLKKVDAILHDRVTTHFELSRRLSTLPGVHTMVADLDEKPSWWAFAFRCDSVGPDRRAAFLAALAAEGVPFSQGYIGTEPLFRTQMMQQRNTFGQSHLPWSLVSAEYEYDTKDFPGCMHFLAQSFVMNWNENFTDSDLDDIEAAIRKVCCAFQ